MLEDPSRTQIMSEKLSKWHVGADEGKLVVGKRVGGMEGERVGEIVGDTDGAELAEGLIEEGLKDEGELVGELEVGDAEGETDGAAEGEENVGELEGDTVGSEDEGDAVGASEMEMQRNCSWSKSGSVLRVDW
jgi:hypothetical protein